MLVLFLLKSLSRRRWKYSPIPTDVTFSHISPPFRQNSPPIVNALKLLIKSMSHEDTFRYTLSSNTFIIVEPILTPLTSTNYNQTLYCSEACSLWIYFSNIDYLCWKVLVLHSEYQSSAMVSQHPADSTIFWQPSRYFNQKVLDFAYCVVVVL